jgi:hypothetical protein
MVYHEDDFSILNGNILSDTPLTIELNGADIDKLGAALCLKLKWYDSIITHHAEVKLLSADGQTVKLEKVKNLGSTENDSHFIEFKEYFEIKTVGEDEKGELRYRVDKLNNRFRSTLSNQIKKVITDETLTNQYILKMLMKIDSKLDELIDTLKEDEKLEGLSEMRTLGLGGGGLSFIYDGCRVSVGDTVYVQSMPKNGSGLNFSALCTVTDVIPYGGKCICEADFSHLDESTREAVIHYIFQKDRETLKRNRA